MATSMPSSTNSNENSPAMPEPPAPYLVTYSSAVLQRLRELGEEALARGDGVAFVAALKSLHQRLTIYPQFGDPVKDMAHGGGQLRVGIIRPISIRYGVHEESRTVFCGTLPLLLPMDKPKA